MGAIPRKTLPDNLVQWRIDQDPSVPCDQLGGSEDLRSLDDVRLSQLDGLIDQMPTEGLPPGIPLWISQPVEVRLVRKHLPEVRIVIESMQRELQLARQRLRKRRFTSATCTCDKDMLSSTDLHLAFFLFSSGLSRILGLASTALSKVSPSASATFPTTRIFGQVEPISRCYHADFQGTLKCVPVIIWSRKRLAAI
jgi:hypothetical protein